MASPARLKGKDKAAAWEVKRGEIGLLIAEGMDLHQIEEKLQRDGTRVTAQVREHIIWEISSPQVRELLAQGLNVAGVEEKMRMRGWIWTNSLRRKAWWEYYREEIIGLYKKLRSVESVREVMAKKGFTPQPRIYYDWLRRWGIPTSINRSNLSEMDTSSYGSPFGGSSSATPASTNVQYHQAHGSYEVSVSEPSYSPLTHLSGNDNDYLSLQNTLVDQDEGSINIYQTGGGLMDADKNHNVEVLCGPSQLQMPTVPFMASPTEPHQSGNQHYELNRVSGEKCWYHYESDSDKSNEGENDTCIQNTTQVPGLDRQDRNTSYDIREQRDRLPRMVNQQNGAFVSWQMNEAPFVHRVSADSGYSSNKPSLLISTGFEHPHKSRPTSSLENSMNQELNDMGWAFQSGALHEISCEVNHENMGFNFTCCGSSRLQELAYSAMSVPAELVCQRLSSYMQLDGVGSHDHAGNTFLHKLAVLGAPCEYFEAAFQAGVDPRHRNAYGQTFAHVINVSAFHDNLIEFLTSLQKLGVDFSLRDNSGRTILHCLYGQPISPQLALGILELIEAPGRQLSRRDVFDRTPYEIFKDTYLRGASENPRWSKAEPQLQILGVFEDLVSHGVLRLGDESRCRPSDVNNPDDLREELQAQYQKVIDNAKDGIVVEAFDGSNAFHAQAAFIAAHDADTDFQNLAKFIDVGIDTNDYDVTGRTPLEAIITQPRAFETELTTSEMVSLLVDKGKANLESRNRLGHTPLYSAAIRGLDRTVEALLTRNSHVNVRANDGQSLFDAVNVAFNQALFKFYESGLTIYREAQCGHIQTCKILLERYGAVSNPTLAQAKGYPVTRPSLPN